MEEREEELRVFSPHSGLNNPQVHGPGMGGREWGWAPAGGGGREWESGVWPGRAASVEASVEPSHPSSWERLPATGT